MRREWSPAQHPCWLVFEAEQRLQIRPAQYKVAQHLMDNPGAICQLNMVGGCEGWWLSCCRVGSGAACMALLVTTPVLPDAAGRARARRASSCPCCCSTLLRNRWW